MATKKESPAKKKAAAKKAAAAEAAQPSPPTEAPPAKRAPAKKRKPADDAKADAIERRLGAVHEQAQQGVDVGGPDAELLPWEGPAAPATYEAPSDEEAEAAVRDASSTALSSVVERALRFVDPKLNPDVLLYPTMIVGSGPKGVALVPWNVPELNAHGHVVNGPALKRMLQRAGKEATLVQRSDGGVIVRGVAGRYNLAPSSTQIAIPQFPDQSAYQPLDPALVHAASLFAGADDIEPPMLSGVHIGRWIEATDRYSLFVGAGGVPGLDVILPRHALAGVDGQVYVAPGANGSLFIAVPSTGEYRMVAPWAGPFVDVKRVADSFSPAFRVDIPIPHLVDALKGAAVVQKKSSAVKLYIGVHDNGAFLELRAGAEHAGDFVTRMTVYIHGSPVLPGGATTGGMMRIMFSGQGLERLIRVSPNPATLTLGFGGDPHRPIEEQPCVLETQTFRAVLLPMRG